MIGTIMLRAIVTSFGYWLLALRLRIARRLVTSYPSTKTYSVIYALQKQGTTHGVDLCTSSAEDRTSTKPETLPVESGLQLAGVGEGRDVDQTSDSSSEDGAPSTPPITLEDSISVLQEGFAAHEWEVSYKEHSAGETLGSAANSCGGKVDVHDEDLPISQSESVDEGWDRALVNLDALRLAVPTLLPGEECVKAEPFACGSYNAVARLTLGSGRVILGRVTCEWDVEEYHPFPAFKERSEMATIQYLRTHTSIPVAEIYARSDDEDKAVGGKFTLQELLPGKCLAVVWDELSDAARKCLFEQIADIRLQLFHLSFDAIGSLSAVETPDGQRSFTVGPIVEMKVNRDDLVGPPPEPGPWSISREWLATLARGGLRYEIDSPPVSYRYSNRDWVAHMTELARRLDNGVPYDGDLAVCGMRHYDFDLQNILVEASPDGSSAKITGIIDWDGAQIIPRWALAAPFRFVTWHNPENEPDLCRWIKYCGELMLRDELYARAQREGRKARELYRLLLWFGRKDVRLEIEDFESGIWGEDHAQWF